MLYLTGWNTISDGKGEISVDDDLFIKLYIDLIKKGVAYYNEERVAFPETFLNKSMNVSESKEEMGRINKMILSANLTEDSMIVKIITTLDEMEKFENYMNQKLQETIMFIKYAPSINRDFLRLMDGFYLEARDMREKAEKSLEEYVNRSAPNLGKLVGYKVAARLINATGSLRKIALSSSSSIQVIGAEKAFFRFKKGNGEPPKHGLIYEIPDIYRAPKKMAGKISRTYANAIVKAARADLAGIQSDIDLKLKKRIGEIRKGQ